MNGFKSTMRNDNHLTELQIMKYQSGKMTSEEMHRVELHALECDFCNDALEGFSTTQQNEIEAGLKELKQSFSTRIQSENRKGSIPFYAIGIAASVLLIGFVTIFLFIKNTGHESNESVIGSPMAKKDAMAKETIDSVPEPSNRPLASRENNPSQASEIKTEKKHPDQKDRIVERKENLEEAPPLSSLPSKPVASQNNSQAPEGVNIKIDSQVFAQAEESEKMAKKQTQDYASSAKQSMYSDMARKKENIVTGKITGENGEGLPGVSIVLKGTTIGTITDSEGNYKIPLPSPNQTLQISYIGYNTLEIKLDSNQTTANANLYPDVSALAEVVVTGYSTEEDITIGSPRIIKARPAQGLRKFREYLKQNTIYPAQAKQNNIEGKVVVQFNVEPDGKLSDFRIKKSLGAGFDEEALRLIKEGPEWLPGTLNGTPVRQEIAVKIPFKIIK